MRKTVTAALAAATAIPLALLAAAPATAGPEDATATFYYRQRPETMAPTLLPAGLPLREASLPSTASSRLTGRTDLPHQSNPV
ncbi:hypothetical protein SRABI91_04589 [Rhodococcoides fascians]|nr:hypothetical protein SRABI91_04589 [Rhodococcus fascians]